MRTCASFTQLTEQASYICTGTFPELKFLHTHRLTGSPISQHDADGDTNDGELNGALYEILECFVCYRPDVGYVQGMSYIAAVLLMNIGNTYQAFMCLANLLNQQMYFQFYTMNAEKMAIHIDAFNELLAEYLPAVHTHLHALGVKVDMFLYEWLLTIYSRSLPLDITHRIWDNFLVIGSSFLFRTGLGLLHMNQSALLRSNFEQCLDMLMHPPSTMECNVLFDSIAAISLSPNKLDTLIRQIHKTRADAAMQREH